MSPDAVRSISRRLRDVVEPVAGCVYFAKEAQDAYAELGLGYPPGYFCSRSACMGQLPGEVVAATFGVFYPPMVVGFVHEGWSKTDAQTILDARRRGATSALERMLSRVPAGAERATELLRRAADAAPLEGRAIFSGLRSLDWPGDAIGDLWRAADLVREHRGDSHVAAWVSAGLTPVEVGLLTEGWWGLRFNSYIRTRGWPEDEVTTTLESLRERGWIDDEGLTPTGTEVRDEVEAATDQGEAAVVEALGDDAEELLDLLDPWATAIVKAGGYPVDPRSLTRP